jgi:hypothetical protein
MVAARDAVGLLNLGSMESAPSRFPFLIPGVPQDPDFVPFRVPSWAATAGTEKERDEIVTSAWAEQVSRTHPLRQDKPGTFITRKGRRVGVHTAQQNGNGAWEFSFPERTLNVLVLLAEQKDGSLRDYVLPPKVLQENWPLFEREQSGANKTVRISVRQDSEGSFIPLGNISLRIQKYQGDYSALT